MEYSYSDKMYIYQLKKQNVPYRIIKQKLWAKRVNDELQKFRTNYSATPVEDFISLYEGYGFPKSHFGTVAKEIGKVMDTLEYFHISSPLSQQVNTLNGTTDEMPQQTRNFYPLFTEL